MPVLAGTEPAGFDYRSGVCESVSEGKRVMSIATETHRPSSFAVPPLDDFGMKRHPRVYFKNSAATGQRAQHSAKLVFEVTGLVLAALTRPVPHRVVDVGKHLEIAPGINHAADFGQVPAHHRLGLPSPVCIGDLYEGIWAMMQRVLAANHQIKVALAQQAGCRLGMPVRLTQLDARQNLKVREALTAAQQAFEVALQSQRRGQQHPLRDVRPEISRKSRLVPQESPGCEIGVIGKSD